MTLTVSGRSLSRLSRRATAKAAWLTKLARNAGRKLNRIGDLVTLSPASLNPTKEGNRIVLVYIGPATNFAEFAPHLTRIQKVLGVTLDTNNRATVKFSRITAEVELRYTLAEKKAA